MADTGGVEKSDPAGPAGQPLPAETARVVRTARRLRWALIAFAVANSVALVSVFHLNRLIMSHYTPMLDGVLHVKQSVIRSHLWFREYLMNDDPLGLEEILWHLDQARAMTENVVEGRQVHLLVFADKPDTEMQSQWLLLLDKIWQLQGHAAAAIRTERESEPLRLAASKYDGGVRDVISFADLLEAQLESRINGHRDWLHQLQLAGIGFFVLLVMTGALFFQRGIHQLSAEIRRRWEVERKLERSREKAVAARDELAEAVAAKDQFLGKVSHEVRTPINAIFGLATMIESTQLNETQRSYLRMLEAETHALLRVMEDLLDLSKLRSHKLGVHPAIIDLRRLLADAVDLCVAEADAKGVLLDLDLPLDCPEAFVADPSRIRQVILNLLKNAIKFTEQGTVVVGLRSQALDGGANRVELWVRDTGSGIPRDKREHVFDPFAQADETTTRKYGGTGLGLAICRELVTLMGGEIRFEDVTGGGTKFLVTLPLQTAEGSAATPAADRLDGQRLLVVDLDDDLRRRTCRLLSDSGATVEAVDSGAQAVQVLHTACAEQNRHHAVIASDRLADVTLAQFVTRLRADQRLAGIRIVATRKNSAYLNTLSALQDHMTVQIAAPYRMLELPALLLARPAQQQDAPSARERKGKKASPLSSRLEVLLVDDHPVMQIAGRHMLESIGCRVDSAPDGASALRQWASKNYDVIFLDGEMPDIDGLEVARRIRAQETEPLRPRPYIVGIAANAMVCDRERCLEAGMDEYVSKPITQESFIRVLRRFSDPKGSEDRDPQRRPSSGTQSGTATRTPDSTTGR